MQPLTLGRFNPSEYQDWISLIHFPLFTFISTIYQGIQGQNILVEYHVALGAPLIFMEKRKHKNIPHFWVIIKQLAP